MPVLGNVKFNWDVLVREAEFIRWKTNEPRKFKANKNTDKESQAAFLRDWLGATDEMVLESYRRSEVDKETIDTIFDKLDQNFLAASNQILYKTNFHD